jgi:hypothetical protein
MKNLRVVRIEHKVAKPFIVVNHYSRNCPAGLNIFFGAYLDDELYAVAAYGMGSNMDKGASLARRTGLPVRFQNVTQGWIDNPPKNTDVVGLTVGSLNCFELKRLCRLGAKGEAKIPLTRFLSICHKILKREHNISYVVSYSDPGQLKTKKVDGVWVAYTEGSGAEMLKPYTCGFIYKAANFVHLDRTKPETHTVDSEGNIVHRRVAYKEMKRWNEKNPQSPKQLREVREARGCVPIVTPPKERWFIAI